MSGLVQASRRLAWHDLKMQTQCVYASTHHSRYNTSMYLLSYECLGKFSQVEGLTLQ